MWKNCLVLVFVIFAWSENSHLVLGQDQQNPLLSYEVIYNWQELDYAFESPNMREDLIKSEKFIPKNNVITGIKVSGNRVFLTVPRWRTGVPATLVSLPNTGQTPAYQNVTNGPALIPYPNWKMNELGNCSALQYVQSMEIDQFHRMWVVDVGRTNIFGDKPDNKCPPKLVLIDIKTNKTLKTYEFPETVVNRTSSFLNDIVVGCTSKEECWAYITDASDARIIVYNYKQNRSWFVRHPSMLADTNSLNINIQGDNYTFNTNVDGIALSPIDTNFSRVFFTPLSSYDLFSVSTRDLQKVGESNENAGGGDLEDSVVRKHGEKSSHTDGMTIDASGLLYFGLLENSAVNSWNTSYANLTDKNQPLLVQNDIDLQWPDTFSIDEKGYVFVTTNRLQKYQTNTIDFDEINFRVIRFFIGLKSYMYSKKETIDQNPVAEPEPETEPEPEAEPKPEPSAEPEPSSEPEPESEPEPKNSEGKPILVHPNDNKTRYDVDSTHHHHDHEEHHDHEDNSISGQSRQIKSNTNNNNQSSGSRQLFDLGFSTVSLVLAITAQIVLPFLLAVSNVN